MKKLLDALKLPTLPSDELQQLEDFLVDAQDVFTLEITQESLSTLIDGILYYEDPRSDLEQRITVPQHLRSQLLDENHHGRYGGHFQAPSFTVLRSNGGGGEVCILMF